MKNNQQKNDTRFWILSVAFHSLLIVLFFFTPLGQRILKREDKPKPKIIRRDEDLAKVVDQIRQLAVGRLSVQVDTLEEISAQMESQLQETGKRYQGFLDEQLASAHKRFMLQGQETIRWQHSLLGALRAFTESDDPDPDSLDEILNACRLSIERGQAEFRRVLLLAAPDDSDLLTKHEQLVENQFAAFEAISSAVKARSDEIKMQKALEGYKAEQAELLKMTTSNEEQFEMYRKEYEQLKEERRQSGGMRRRAEVNLEQITNAITKAKAANKETTELEARQEEARQSYAQWQIKAREIEENYEAAQLKVRQLKKKLDYQSAQIPFLTEKIPAIIARLPEQRSKCESSAAKALSLQSEVVEGQSQLYSQLMPMLEEISNRDDFSQEVSRGRTGQ